MSTVMTPAPFARELREICGAGYVIDDPAKLEAANILGVSPALAVEPASAPEVAAILRLANERGLNVVPAGGGTLQQAGSVPAPIDVLLYTTRLTEIEHYDPGDLTVGIGAGFRVAKLCSMVGASGLLFAGDPPAYEQATIGGTLATGVIGPRRHGYGGLRDYCIGIRFVPGDGRSGKGGGRVVKNVAGYDMMKLLIGSWGTLAVITGASFKLFPIAHQMRTFVADFSSAAEAVDYCGRVLRSPLSPMCLEVVSPEAQALLPGPPKAAWSIYVRANGSDAVLARYRSELGKAVGREIEGDDELAVWRALADFPHTVALREPSSVLLSLFLPLADVQGALLDAQSVADANGAKCAVIGRAGIGQILVALWPTPDAQAGLAAAASAFCSKLGRDSSAFVLHCSGPLRKASASWEKTPTHPPSMQAVKRALDPKDILNRGRFVF